MKNIILILSVLILAGCASMNQFDGEISSPELLKQYPLPPIPASIYSPNFSLNLKLLILENGTVKHATILNKTGNEEWDSLAQESILKWVYIPAHIKDKPVSMWVNQRVCVDFKDPVYMDLAEILCDTLETAQRIYEALSQNENFGEQALKYSVAPSHSNNGMLGKVDIRLYPNYIQREILSLRKNEFTKPIKYGDQYIIFKKISD